MRSLKAIAATACLLWVLVLGSQTAWYSFLWGPFWFKFEPGIFCCVVLAVATILLILFFKPRPLCNSTKILIIILIGAVVAGPLALDVHIRHERKILQVRAKEFLSRPIPELLLPDAEGYVGGMPLNTNGPQNGVLGYSRTLIERYATNGRIRWSSRIAGQFSTPTGVNFNYRSEAIKSNPEVCQYVAEKDAILSKEWQMGFWQTIEDVMELRLYPPEFAEEDAPHSRGE